MTLDPATPVSHLPPRRELGKLQFGLVDLAIWMAGFAVMAALWRVSPLLTMLLLLCSVPSVFRERAYRRLYPEMKFRERVTVFVMCGMLEALLSVIAMFVASLAGYLGGICGGGIAMMLHAAEIVDTPQAVFLVLAAVLGVMMSLAAYIFVYECLRRDTWPKKHLIGGPPS
jgi:hypothetical protein